MTPYSRYLNDAIEALQTAADIAPADKAELDFIIDRIMMLEAADAAIERRDREERRDY